MSEPRRPRRSSSVRRSEEARNRRPHTESPPHQRNEKEDFRPRSSGHASGDAGPSNVMTPEEHEQRWRQIDPSIHRTSHSTQGSAGPPGYDAARVPSYERPRSYHTTASSARLAEELDDEARRISDERNRRIGVGRDSDELDRRFQRGNTGLAEQRMAAPRPRPPPERVAATTPISRVEAGHGPQSVLHSPPPVGESASSGGSSGSRRRRAAQALRSVSSRVFRRGDGGNNNNE
ncbi:hypothetical protein BCR35DRAFT_298152 [Leucosporidium creatinivorum]|uniref:Uncharacterized protein n=1 Tax=Leucosporidium creatinivorum TaxID=106004 RepID=A0A1Y2G5P1_9BASI|nr:hypothetical protein BCR35DRAFT_298152 [Leucosporidium creatinivorum]